MPPSLTNKFSALSGQIKDPSLCEGRKVQQKTETCLRYVILSARPRGVPKKRDPRKTPSRPAFLAIFFLRTRRQHTRHSNCVLAATQGLFGFRKAWRNSAPSSERYLIVTLIITVITDLSFRNALGYQWQHGVLRRWHFHVLYSEH